jgi:hypothetical protein
VSLQRRTPLARGKAIARLTRLAPVNRKRKAAAFERNFGKRAEHVRASGCIIGQALARELDEVEDFASRLVVAVGHEQTGRACDFGPAQAAHARARGMGGCKGDRRDLVPLCARHHAQAGELGTSQRADFERLHSISITAEAARIAAELDERGIP